VRKSESRRAFQLHNETADIPFGQEGSLFLQEAEEPHRRYQAFHLPICHYNLTLSHLPEQQDSILVYDTRFPECQLRKLGYDWIAI